MEDGTGRPVVIAQHTDRFTVVRWETQHNTADVGYCKTQLLQATLGIRNQPLESCVFLEVELLSQSVGCTRNRLLFRTVPRSLSHFSGCWVTYGWVTCS